mgnify:CR=1 FL=1
MYKLSLKSIRHLNGVNSLLIAIIIKGLETSPFDFGIPRSGGKRTNEEQENMYARGRTTKQLLAKGIIGVEGQPNKSVVTWTLNSKHKPKGKKQVSHAFDIYAYVNGKASWDMKYLKPIAEHLKKVAKEEFAVELQWGYDLWKKDAAHFQIK